MAQRESEQGGAADAGKSSPPSEEPRGQSSGNPREDIFRCYNCNKPGHMARDCPNPPRNPKYVDTRGTRVEDVMRRERGRDDDRYRRDFPDRDRDRDRDRDMRRGRSPPRDYLPPPRDYPPARPPSPRRYPPAYGREFDPRYDSRSASYDPRGGYADPRAAPPAYADRRYPSSSSGRPYDAYGGAPSASSSSSYDRPSYSSYARYDSRYPDARDASAVYPPARGEWLEGRSAGSSSSSYGRGGVEYPPYQHTRGRSRSPERRRAPSPPRDYRASGAMASHARDAPLAAGSAGAAASYPPVARDYAGHSHSSQYAASGSAEHRR